MKFASLLRFLSIAAVVLTIAELVFKLPEQFSFTLLWLEALILGGLVYELDIPRVTAGRRLPKVVRLYTAVTGGLWPPLLTTGLAVAMTVMGTLVISSVLGLAAVISRRSDFNGKDRLSSRYLRLYQAEKEDNPKFEITRLFFLSRFSVSVVEALKFLAVAVTLIEATLWAILIAFPVSVLAHLVSLELSFFAIVVAWSLVVTIKEFWNRVEIREFLVRVYRTAQNAEEVLWKIALLSFLTPKGSLYAYSVLPAFLLASMGALLVIMALVGRPFGSTFLVGASAAVSTVIWPAYFVILALVLVLLPIFLFPLYVLIKLVSASVSRRQHKPLPRVLPGTVLVAALSAVAVAMIQFNELIHAFLSNSALASYWSYLVLLALLGAYSCVVYLIVRGEKPILTAAREARLIAIVTSVSTLYYFWSGALVEAVLIFGLYYVMTSGIEKGGYYVAGRRIRLFALIALVPSIVYLHFQGLTTLVLLGVVGVGLLLLLSFPTRIQHKIIKWLFRLEEHATEPGMQCS